METQITQESRVIPALFTANVAILFATFAIEFIFGDGTMTYWFGFLPQRLTDGLVGLSPTGIGYSLISALTYQFLHGGIMHFFSNMAILILFGSYVEKSMGPGKFLGFYLLCGFLAALFHYLFNFASYGGVIGASGSVAGVGGAFIVLLFFRKIPVSSFTLMGTVVIGMWLWGQFQGAFQELVGTSTTGVAYLTHLGGFAAGFLLSVIHQKKSGRAVKG